MSNLKNFAIETAKERVGRLFQIGNNWSFLIWVDNMNAWVESSPKPYHNTLHNRSQRLIDCARNIMGLNHKEYTGGDWRLYLK